MLARLVSGVVGSYCQHNDMLVAVEFGPVTPFVTEPLVAPWSHDSFILFSILWQCRKVGNMAEEEETHSSGLMTFVCIMTSSFFVFAFINGMIHYIFVAPNIGADAVLRFTETMMPIILMILLFSLVWMAMSLFRNVRWTTAVDGGRGPSYATLSSLEAPEPYGRMEAERQELLKSPRLTAKKSSSTVGSEQSIPTLSTAASDGAASDGTASEQAAIAEAKRASEQAAIAEAKRVRDAEEQAAVAAKAAAICKKAEEDAAAQVAEAKKAAAEARLKAEEDKREMEEKKKQSEQQAEQEKAAADAAAAAASKAEEVHLYKTIPYAGKHTHTHTLTHTNTHKAKAAHTHTI
jgi:hypothetical protein